MRIRALASFAALLAMCLAFFGYIASLGLRISPPDDRTNLSMDVPDINNLVVESNVLLRGIPVGNVSQIDTSTLSATVHFYIDNKYKVPVDSVVRLDNLSALGESYIELEPRVATGPTFHNGQHIATERIKRPPSISELATSVVRVLNQMDPGQLSRVLDEADKALPDPNAVLPNLARASLLLRNTTADLHGQGQDLMTNLQTLLENAGWVGPALADAAPSIRGLGPPAHNIWNEGTNIILRTTTDQGSVYIFGKFLKRIQKLLDDRGSDIRVLTEPLMANVKAIAASLQTIDSSQVLANLLASVPEDGAIELHVKMPEDQSGQ